MRADPGRYAELAAVAVGALYLLLDGKNERERVFSLNYNRVSSRVPPAAPTSTISYPLLRAHYDGQQGDHEDGQKAHHDVQVEKQIGVRTGPVEPGR